jgi:hypothetical protein
VVPVAPAVTGAAVIVVVESSVDDVGADELDVVGRAVVVVVAGRVVVGDWVATCCLGELSLPVAISNSRAASAMVAST